MSKSRCELCHKVLKGGDGMYRLNDDGRTIKICKDREQCLKRMRANTFKIASTGANRLTDKSL